MEVDRKNKNCYNYGRFGYIARNCKNRRIRRRIGQRIRLEYGNNEQKRIIEGENKKKNNNLNENRDLIVLD